MNDLTLLTGKSFEVPSRSLKQQSLDDGRPGKHMLIAESASMPSHLEVLYAFHPATI